jgi:hypothetical protein
MALVKLPRHPSPTAAATRATRREARAWIALKGWTTWKGGGLECCNAHTSAVHSADEGAMVPSGNAGHPLLVVCLDCIPYPTAPLRGHEKWATDAETGRGVAYTTCARCHRTMQTRGGMYSRGGPFCWDCGTPAGGVYDAWVGATEVQQERPWEHEDEVEAVLVREVERTVKVWEVVS